MDSEQTRKQKPPKLYSIQIGRGIAALLVLAFHANDILKAATGGALDYPILITGHSGVQFFFVLSGFIIYHIHWKDIGHPHSLQTFAYKRFVRIYPIYWILLFAFLPVWFFYDDFGIPERLQFLPLVKSLTLVPQQQIAHIGVAWTLVHEVFFYTFFALLILTRRAWSVFLFWQAAIVATLVAGTVLPFPLSFILNPNNLLFGGGMLVAGILRNIGHRQKEPMEWLLLS